MQLIVKIGLLQLFCRSPFTKPWLQLKPLFCFFCSHYWTVLWSKIVCIIFFPSSRAEKRRNKQNDKTLWILLFRFLHYFLCYFFVFLYFIVFEYHFFLKKLSFSAVLISYNSVGVMKLVWVGNAGRSLCTSAGGSRHGGSHEVNYDIHYEQYHHCNASHYPHRAHQAYWTNQYIHACKHTYIYKQPTKEMECEQGNKHELQCNSERLSIQCVTNLWLLCY